MAVCPDGPGTIPTSRFLSVLLVVLASIALLFLPKSARAATSVEQSVVKINVTQREPDFFRPWAKAGPEQVSGSGAVIAGNRILTNAHVVMYAARVTVQLRGGGDQLPAKVTAVAPGIDLAIVELVDPSRLMDTPALELVKELPQLRSRIHVYGYPTGGDDLSVTNGIVSRIEFSEYGYDTWGVRIQVDAALNPGNSGGPAIQEGKIVGLVFSKIEQAENIGYLIPTQEIRQFLEDAADGRCDGAPMLFDHFQTAENPALRASLKIPNGTTGLVVQHPASTVDDYPLKEWDVVTHIGPHAIDNQGYIDVGHGLRMLFLYHVPRLAEDGKIELTLLREGKEKIVQVPVSPRRNLLVPSIRNEYPEYLICGPLVLTSASQEFIREMGSQWRAYMARVDNPALMRFNDAPDEPGNRLVLATQLFSHPLIHGYSDPPFSVVARLNGVSVKNLRHLAELVNDSQDEFLRFEMADRSESLVFRREEILAATEAILSDEGCHRAFQNRPLACKN